MREDIIRDRKEKLAYLRKIGIDPYPSRVQRTHTIHELQEQFTMLARAKKSVTIVGRALSVRNQGSILFIDIKDGTGKLQALLKKDVLANFSELQHTVDPGDFVEVAGVLFVTKKGERSIEAHRSRIIAKTLQGIPSVWYGIKDVEERFRKRYLDILLNEEVNEKLKKRSAMIQELRTILEKEGFLEVETPIFQPIPGGAKARPFVTHHNALDADFYLRIAPELYLKRLLAAGWEKIYEIGRVFRNEGIDRDHNPEFTMLELYWAYQDYEGLMRFTQKILKRFVKGKWTRITFSDAFKKYAQCENAKLSPDSIDEIFKRGVRPRITAPTFIVDYPKSISPLAKSKSDNSELTERFQLIIDGTEIVNGFSELNDPIDQRARMEAQERLYRAGDEEASRLDEEFLEMLEYGMPPSAGLGIGIDRLVAVATRTHAMKEIIPFPTLRPKK